MLTKQEIVGFLVTRVNTMLHVSEPLWDIQGTVRTCDCGKQSRFRFVPKVDMSKKNTCQMILGELFHSS